MADILEKNVQQILQKLGLNDRRNSIRAKFPVTQGYTTYNIDIEIDKLSTNFRKNEVTSLKFSAARHTFMRQM